jgi:hypothetical protein
MSPSTIHAKDNQESGRLPQNFKDDILGIICIEDVRFMAHYQLGWYVAQMHDSAERISQ